MKLIYVLLLLAFVTIISAKTKIPVKKVLHSEHTDDKWDSSDMDEDNDSIELKGENSGMSPPTANRRFLPMRPENSSKIAKILPHIKSIWIELLKLLEGSDWHNLGRTILNVIDAIIEFVKKS